MINELTMLVYAAIAAIAVLLAIVATAVIWGAFG
jgi:hypothetical protein